MIEELFEEMLTGAPEFAGADGGNRSGGSGVAGELYASYQSEPAVVRLVPQLESLQQDGRKSPPKNLKNLGRR